MAVTWLHISDLHVRSGDSYDRDVVFRALVTSVKSFRERQGRSPDLVFVTGDVAYSGKANEYDLATRFFDQLLESAGLDRRRLYIVPGNHDVDRAIGSQLIRTFYSREDADAYFQPGARKLHLEEKIGSFLKWHGDYFEGIRKMPQNSTCGPVEQVNIRGTKIGILPINTALFCHDDSDHDKLFVGRRCLDPALEELRALGTQLRVGLMHHPLEFLSSIERQNIRSSLFDKLDVVLMGHVHEPGIVNVQMPSSRNLYCAAGATYQTRDRPNTAYYATFRGDRIKILPIRYEDQPREVWTVDPSLYPEATSFEGSYVIPREPDSQSSGTQRWDGKYQRPPKLLDKTKSLERNVRGDGARSVAFVQAMGLRTTKKRTTQRSKAKSKGKPKG